MLNIKFHESTFSGVRVAPSGRAGGRTDGRTDGHVAPWNFLKMEQLVTHH